MPFLPALLMIVIFQLRFNALTYLGGVFYSISLLPAFYKTYLN